MERRNITFAQCDSMDEVHGHIKRHEETIYAQNECIEKLETQLGTVEAILGKVSRDVKKLLNPEPKTKQEPKGKPKGKGRKKGFVSMKALVGLIALLLFAASAFGANITYDQASNPQLLVTWINNNVNTGFYAFTPRTTPPSGADATEGAVYYNDDTDTFYGYVAGTTWTAFATASGNSLDEAYNTGVKIFVDGDVIELEVADGADNVALLIDNNEVTNNNDSLQIVHEGTGDLISLDGASTGNLIYDEDGNFTVASTGALTAVGVTTTAELIVTAADVLFDGTYDIAYDTSKDQILFQDTAKLGIGGAHDAVADMYFAGDGTDVVLEVATEDGADLLIGYTNALDVAFYSATNTSFMIWDQSAAELIFDAADLRMNDDDQMFFGDGATDSFSIDFDEVTDNLVIVATTANDQVQIGDGTTATDFVMMSTATDTSAITWFDADGDTNNGQFKFGIDDHGQDVIFFGATITQQVNWDQSADTWYFGADAEGVDVYTYGDTTVNYMFWDESDNRLEMVHADVFLDDDSDIIIGSGADWLIESDAATVLEFIPTTSNGTSAFHIGTAANTADVLIYGETASELITWDAGADSLTVVGDLALFTLTGTTKPFYVNVTGTVAGVATELKTTDGGIKFDADGAANGDITIDAADVITIVSTDADGVGIYIHANGGASEEINIHSDQGTGDESIYAYSDVGGITLKAAAGSIDIEPTGGTGDLGLTVGNDMTVTVAGNLVYAVTGTTTLPDDILRSTTVAVTAVQADNLRATPKELVAAEAGKMHEFVKCIVALDWGAQAYTESDDNLAVRYENTTGVIVSDVIEATGLADATEDTVCFAGPAPTTSALVTEANSTNKALVLHGTGTSEWGNSGDSPLVIITYYRTHTTAELGLN